MTVLFDTDPTESCPFSAESRGDGDPTSWEEAVLVPGWSAPGWARGSGGFGYAPGAIEEAIGDSFDDLGDAVFGIFGR